MDCDPAFLMVAVQVLYLGEHTLSLGDRLWACPVSILWAD